MFKSKSGIEVADTTTLTKQDIREKVWSYMEENDLANYPRPVSNRIPNFKGAAEAGQKISSLPFFSSASTVKINPDKPQEEVRFLTLEARKVLLVPTPRLLTGLFNQLTSQGDEDKATLRTMSQIEGLKKFAKPVGLEAQVKIDLIVIGSVAVSRTGYRIGKGEGFADFEYAMMKSMKAIDNSIPIVTTVHDCQVFDDLPERIFKQHDVPIDFIITPTEVYTVNHKLHKPEGIYWSLLSPEKFREIPILRFLREREQENGIDVTLADGVELPSPEELRPLRRGQAGRGRGEGRGGPRGDPRGEDRGEGRGEARGARGGGRRRGRGRGGRTTSEGDDKGPRNLQVTINVSKKNRIVRRTVEATSQPDRLGSADLEEHERLQKPRKPRLPITYAVFLGKVPTTCRVRELKDTLIDRDVRPADITWRGRNGFAFLRFTGAVEECDDVLTKLEGLTLQEKPVIIEKAKDKDLAKDGYENGVSDTDEDGRPRRVRRNSSRKTRQPITYAIFLGKVPPMCRVRELKEALMERDVHPADITWRGRSGFAFLRFSSPPETCDDTLSKLQGLHLKEKPLVVEKAKDKDITEGDDDEDKGGSD